MYPAIADGHLGPQQPPFPSPVLGIAATINSVVAPVLFAGQAPGLIAGAIQVNLQISLSEHDGRQCDGDRLGGRLSNAGRVYAHCSSLAGCGKTSRSKRT